MEHNAAYHEAERKIEEARRTGATELDLSVPYGSDYSEKLKELPDSIGQLTGLQWLDLDNNQLSALPDWMGQLTGLQWLDLGNNQLIALPDSMGQLTGLQVLHLGNNQLSALPESMGQLTGLLVLTLGNNQLSALPDWMGQLTGLHQLSLVNNQLSALPDWMGQLTGLLELDLGNNQLNALPESMGQLTGLQELSLVNNQLSALPESMGQLTALQRLDLDNNQLSALPESMGQLTGLQRLTLDNNPLPDDIRQMSREQILAYLRGLAETSEAEQRTFDEAKLLIVGSGEVGKTWLLQALQGKIPQIVSSTKGVEIAREPLDLTHPDQPQRTLHLNCWDFGGQDRYQITHQLFFGPQAIYLLVWKPRTDFGPDLIERLERIQLSAGRSAKVLIVSTHADGEDSATIGREALRERFGDLIHDFYDVDSAKGPTGTGIAHLRDEIALVASRLDVMDVPYPPSWHAAHRAVRALDEPTIPFERFAAICEQYGMKETASRTGLAVVMDTQGHIVYFDETSGSGENSIGDGENIVVLDPEWLAKAISFVIGDKATEKVSGVLNHARLHTIWQQDAGRECPGYGDTGFLLWMMWKADVAYRLNEATSLVPELIHHDRPDNELPWVPAQSTYNERQATLICRLPHDPPAGLIPALTAAVHPLRRVQNLTGGQELDELDRNWRNGFFLESPLRGTAYVELTDRDLKIVVRGHTPKLLSSQIRKTLDRIRDDRWPRLNIDYRVPCKGRLGTGEVCNGSFKRSYLEQRRGKLIPCENCNNDEIEVDHLLEGFDTHDEEISRQLKSITDGQAQLLESQKQLLTVSYASFRQLLDPARDVLSEAPNMFTIVPAEVGNWNLWSRATEMRVRVTCWCEHPDGPHALHGEPDEVPSYILKASQEWLVKAAPYLSWATMLLRTFVPVVGSMTKAALEETLSADWRADIDLMGDFSKALPSGNHEVDRKEMIEARMEKGDRPEIVALRHIHDALRAQVPSSKQWGGLRPVATKSGELLWLCAEHAAIQQPPIPDI